MLNGKFSTKYHLLIKCAAKARQAYRGTLVCRKGSSGVQRHIYVNGTFVCRKGSSGVPRNIGVPQRVVRHTAEHWCAAKGRQACRVFLFKNDQTPYLPCSNSPPFNLSPPLTEPKDLHQDGLGHWKIQYLRRLLLISPQRICRHKRSSEASGSQKGATDIPSTSLLPSATMEPKFLVCLLKALIMSSFLANSRTRASNIIEAGSVQASPEDLHQVKTLETNASEQIGDSYIDSAQKSCLLSKAKFSCTKFRALRYIHELTSPFENERNAGSNFLTNGFTLFGSVHLVSIPASRSSLQSGVLFEGLLDTNPGPGDTELMSFLKFTGREMQRFVRSYAVTMKVPVSPVTYSERAFGGDLPRLIDLDEDARELKEEPRLKKKHLLLLIPLGFLHMKLLILPILLIVLFIKKVIMIVILFLPTVLSWLRVCRKDHGPHWLIPESHSEPHHEPEIYASHAPVHHYGKAFTGRRKSRAVTDAHPLAYRGYEPRTL
uniref:Uncharacterized protein n=1 Tax=Timema bartmani TaxID=61472 RepID=A0A7R9EN82_9NEOP|nr:unnamed protein product [Timema bartmani]